MPNHITFRKIIGKFGAIMVLILLCSFVYAQEYEQKPGIYKVLVEAKSGPLQPGDDLLFIIVAGDIRENVKPVLAELLDRIKAEAVTKKEHA